MLTKAIQTVAATMTGYPKIGFRETTGTMSDIKAKQGIIRMYTSGCPTLQKKSTQCAQPETERIQPWKRHVPRADHQRGQVVRKPEQNGHGHEENHGRTMHREHAVEDLWRNKVIVRIHQLDANDDGFGSTDDKKRQGIEDVKNAQPFVI